jgi:antitoxin component YwqK of YwqJK toxin-antitoxin module
VKRGDLDRTRSISSGRFGRFGPGWLVVPLLGWFWSCATPRTVCPLGSNLVRRIYSGGAEAEWCGRPDGVRQGPERRYYESGMEMVSGGYLDGAQSGVWRYRFNDGRNWRAERWDDGALVQRTVDPSVGRMSAEEIEARGPTHSGIIKLASHDPGTSLGLSEPPGRPFVSYFGNGRPRVAGSTDLDGLRVGIWRFWFEDGRPSREIEYRGGVRERGAREWYPNGAPAADGSYVAGERDGRWRFWDAHGRQIADLVYQDGVRVSPPAVGLRPAVDSTTAVGLRPAADGLPPLQQ